MALIEIRKFFLVVLFLLLCVGVTIFSGKKNQNQDKFWEEGPIRKDNKLQASLFKDINYFYIKDTKPHFNLKAQQLTINNSTDIISFISPNGKAIAQDRPEVFYKADRGFFDKGKDYLYLESNVLVKDVDSDSWSDYAEYFVKEDLLKSRGKVKTKTFYKKSGDLITIKSDYLTSWEKREKSHFKGNVKGSIKRKRVYEESILFNSENLHLLLKKAMAQLIGKVYLEKQSMKAWARKGDLFLDNYSKKLKYFVLYDDVKIVEKVETGEEAFYERKAFAEKLEGINGQQKIILTGYPKVYQQGDMIKGNKIILRQDNQLVEVDDANTKIKLK